MERKFKKGDIVYLQDLQGEVIDIDYYHSGYPIEVKFNTNQTICFTENGRHLSFTPPVLSHTPYTLNGFTQNSVIEKDTLVWVRDVNGSNWQQRFFSHSKNGKYFCFFNQLTSNETEGFERWVFLETENPLLKKLTPKNK